jgi:hypothetical protein
MPIKPDDFEPPPADGSVDELRDRFEAATMQLANNFGRVLDHIADKPRYNEKIERAKRLLKLLEAARAQTEAFLEDLGDVGRCVELLVETMETAAKMALLLADEHQVKPGSIADPAGRPSASPAAAPAAQPDDPY